MKTIPELTIEVAAGSEKAFKELVKRFQRKLYATAYRIVGNHLDADEVVQETFVRIYKKRKELVNVTYFSTFLNRVATNYAIDLLRRKKFTQRMGEDSDSLDGETQLFLSRKVETPEKKFENSVILKEVYSAVKQLPKKQRLTLIYHDIDGYSKKEIADIFECPEATVRSNLHIARSKLRKILKAKENK